MTQTAETTPTSEPSGDVASSTAGNSARKGGRIVVGVDGSDASLDALRRAIRIAGALDLTVEAVTSWRYPTDYADYGGVDSLYSPLKDAQTIGEDASRQIWSGKAPEWFSLVAAEGYAADVLIEQSKGAEMLIVGSRGHSGLVGVLLGSVSARCAERATCPVLIIH